MPPISPTVAASTGSWRRADDHALDPPQRPSGIPPDPRRVADVHRAAAPGSGRRARGQGQLAVGVGVLGLDLIAARAGRVSISLLASAAAATINTALGLATAWVLERHRFAGRGLLDMLIDVPFALPTSVAGITLATLYGPNG